MNTPDNLKYSKSHEWAKIEGNTATMGISEFAVEQLGDITLVELPEVGDSIAQKDSLGTIESVKAVSDLYSPVKGKIIEVNESLEDEPEKVNEDCYGEGWIVKIELADENGSADMLDASSYQDYLDSLDD